MNKELFNKIGNAKIYHWDVDSDMTVNDYLRDLLVTLLEEGEGFSGKRPLGNSGWEDAMSRSIALVGVVEYERTGDPEDEDEDDPSTWEIGYDNKADKLIKEYIVEVFKAKK